MLKIKDNVDTKLLESLGFELDISYDKNGNETIFYHSSYEETNDCLIIEIPNGKISIKCIAKAGYGYEFKIRDELLSILFKLFEADAIEDISPQELIKRFFNSK